MSAFVERKKSYYKVGSCPRSDRELTSVGIFLEKIVGKDGLLVIVVI